MKKIGYYILLFVTCLMVLPYILIWLAIEMYLCIVLGIIGYIVKPFRNAAPFPGCISRVFYFIDEVQSFKYKIK